MKSGPRRAHFACGVKNFLHSSRARSGSPSHGSNPGGFAFCGPGSDWVQTPWYGFHNFSQGWLICQCCWMGGPDQHLKDQRDQLLHWIPPLQTTIQHTILDAKQLHGFVLDYSTESIPYWANSGTPYRNRRVSNLDVHNLTLKGHHLGALFRALFFSSVFDVDKMR